MQTHYYDYTIPMGKSNRGDEGQKTITAKNHARRSA
jgi:hypothetical protein